ncbi:hypothetical protein N7494_001468 [Penicillium frequentans]|uniref:Uncharacterized protein n=1 Tax=Penicillium frequentans TaxID=3151616 RepID=A0AAD6D1Y0_9EURO|nr:hypothetical protein N7494_008413 [Penicillium glabrum]KAJ5552090.1 hypothetical protein N7494_001468 [Penicillium glabrum]
MSSPWATTGTQHVGFLDEARLQYDVAHAAAISAGQDPETDGLCFQCARSLRSTARRLLFDIFTADNIFFAGIPHLSRWVGGPSNDLLRSIESLAHPSSARSFAYLPCLRCLQDLFHMSNIRATALDECRQADYHPHGCPRCDRHRFQTCHRLTGSVSPPTMAILTTAFRSKLGGSDAALPMPLHSELRTSDQARRRLILAMYSEHRRAAWAEYLRFSPGTGGEPEPRPGSDVDALILEQQHREPRLVEEIDDTGE